MNELTPFDRNIREKLKNLEAPYNESHWEQLEEQLSQETETTPDEAGDEFLFSRMSNMEVPYDPSSWELMAKRIDVAFSFRHWLHRNHVPELTLMVLLVFTLIQFLSWEDLQERFAPGSHKHQAPVAPAKRPAAIASLPVLDQSQVVSTEEPCEPVPSVYRPVAAVRLGDPLIPLSVISRDLAIDAHPLFRLPSLPQQVEREALPPLEQYARGSAMAGISALKQFLIRPVRWYVGAYSGVDYNLVRAPMDEEFQTEGYLTDSTGLRAGVLIAVEKGKWQFQTGAVYSKVAYRPILPVQQYGTFDYLVVESFDEIRFQFLQAPLQVRRSFLPEHSKWDVYAFGGVEANLIFNANYDIEKTEIFSSRGAEGADDVSGQSRLSEKIFPEGILHGDGFFKNTYISLSAGVGVERSISPRYKIFAEPVYARPFFGHDIGPNDDRIHQFTFQMGVKLQIK